MTSLTDQRHIRTAEDFGTSAEVHHTNYFRQQRTLDFVAKCLQLP